MLIKLVKIHFHWKDAVLEKLIKFYFGWILGQIAPKTLCQIDLEHYYFNSLETVGDVTTH